MAESITEGTITQFSKQVGDFISQDDELVTIETDKIDVSVNAPHSGVIQKLLAEEGDTVTVDQVIAEIQEAEKTPRKQATTKEEKQNPVQEEKNRVSNMPSPQSQPTQSTTHTPNPRDPVRSAPEPPSQESGIKRSKHRRGEQRVNRSNRICMTFGKFDLHLKSPGQDDANPTKDCPPSQSLPANRSLSNNIQRSRHVAYTGFPEEPPGSSPRKI